MSAANEVPSGIKFEHLLAYTFPGFFSSITLFMIIDICSAIDLTTEIAKDINGLLEFLGFVVLTGTILGIIADGINHSIIEDLIFNNFLGIKIEVKELINACWGKHKEKGELRLTRHYFFKKCGGPEINQYLIEAYYRSSEFYSNAFLALIPFSFVVPFYLNEVLRVEWNLAMYFAFMSLILACFCLNSSYQAYYRYNKSIYSAIMGYEETDLKVSMNEKTVVIQDKTTCDSQQKTTTKKETCTIL